ncbi:MAG: response regulator [Planctomycetes bacterium]|nr:response regulator [Planctomycetota bacterium]
MADLPTIVAVEDNPGDILLLQEAFREAGVEMRMLVAENAVQAYNLMKAHISPDLVLIDLNLPVIPGTAVLREVLSHEPWKRPPAVVLSSSQADRDRTAALEIGADEYVVKPSHFDEYVGLAKRLATYLRRRTTGSSGPAKGRVRRLADSGLQPKLA